MRLSVTHTTRYAFSEPVAYGMQRLRLKPKATHGQAVIDWRMELDGAIAEVEYEDQHLNATSLVTVLPGARELTIHCSSVVDTVSNAGVLGPHIGHMPLWCFLRQTKLTEPGTRVRALVARLDADRDNTLATLHTLSDIVLDALPYQPDATDARTSAEAALAAGKGVCQDHTHVFLSAGRLLGIPMRYVSGYLKLDGSDDQQAGHAWAEAYVERLGWVGFDVANAICPDEKYVRVATGSDYVEAAPITGLSQGSGQTSLEVAVVVGQTQTPTQTRGQASQAQQQGVAPEG